MSPILLLSVLFVACLASDSNAPEQIHVVFGGSVSEYTVSFITFNVASSNTSVVKYGNTMSSLNKEAVGTPHSFVEEPCPIVRVTHNVSLSNLVVGSTVYYTVSGDGVNWSPIFNFLVFDRTKKDRPLTISLVGDMGVPPSCQVSSMNAWKQATQKKEHDFVIHFGDIAYNLDYDCGKVGDNFMRVAQDVAAYTSYVFGVGNHESDPDYTYKAYLSRYTGQYPLAMASRSPSVRYYSFDAQLVHFVMIDTDAWIYSPVFPLASVQWKWLNDDLARVDRTKTPWIILIGHRSMYCTKNTDPECNQEAETIRWGLQPGNQWGIEPLMLKYGVDLYFGGHTHHYMRTWPVKKNVLMQKNYENPLGPIHIQSGIGGVDGNDAFELPMREIDAWRDEKYRVSYGRMVIYNHTHIDYKLFNAADGSLIDQIVVSQETHGPF
jgi:hypothetical protein